MVGHLGEMEPTITALEAIDIQLARLAKRVDELGDASVPFYFDVHAMIFTPDAPALENALHQAFESKRLNLVNRRREYFRVTLNEIKKVVQENYDKTVEFIDVPPAEQYRESILMRDRLTPSKAAV